MEPIKRPRFEGQGGGQYHQLRGNYQPQNTRTDSTQEAYEFATPLNYDDPIAIGIRERVNTIMGSSLGNTQSLDAPLPATLSRRDLPSFKREKTDYVICEKSDGDRALMYINRTGCYLINRKFKIQRVNDEPLQLYINIIPSDAPADFQILLDGEIITNYFNPLEDNLTSADAKQNLVIPPKIRETVAAQENVEKYLLTQGEHERFCYLMFDAIWYGTTDLKEMDLYKRLRHCGLVKERIREYVIGKMKTKYPATEYPNLKVDEDWMQQYIWKHAVLRIETKDFSNPAPRMRYLLQYLIRFPKDKGYLYYNGKKQLKSKNDGFIFTPINNDYKMQRDTSKGIMKYKWPNLNTADFHILRPFYDPDGKLILYSHGYDGTGNQRKIDFEFTRINLPPESREYLNSHISGVQQAVVECNYDALVGNWTVKHIRTDKHKGNFFSTVLSCMEAMIDNLKPEELAEILR